MYGLLRNVLNKKFYNSTKFSFRSVTFSNSLNLSAIEDGDEFKKGDGSLNQESSTQIGSLSQETSTQDSLPSLPTTCCMSGCANCVWLDYADEMVSYYKLKGEQMDFGSLLREVEKNIDDPMIKAFITMELKSKYLFKKS